MWDYLVVLLLNYTNIISLSCTLTCNTRVENHFIEQNPLSYTEDWYIYLEYQMLFIKNILNEMVFHSSIAC